MLLLLLLYERRYPPLLLKQVIRLDFKMICCSRISTSWRDPAEFLQFRGGAKRFLRRARDRIAEGHGKSFISVLGLELGGFAADNVTLVRRARIQHTGRRVLSLRKNYNNDRRARQDLLTRERRVPRRYLISRRYFNAPAYFDFLPGAR